MQKIRKWIKGHKKVPKCVGVYDKLYKMIDMGTFDEEGKLPTEPALAKLMGVSRMTLRQAIALLREDGFIRNVQGKGNFLIKDNKNIKKGLETLQNPIYAIVEEEIKKVELDYKIEPISDYAKNILKTLSEEIIFIDRWYQGEEETLAYTLSLVATETIEKMDIDLEDDKSLLNFLENLVYHKPQISKLKISISKMGNLVSSKYPISKGDSFYLIEEKISTPNGKVIIHNKHYIASDFASLEITRGL